MKLAQEFNEYSKHSWVINYKKVRFKKISHMKLFKIEMDQFRSAVVRLVKCSILNSLTW